MLDALLSLVSGGGGIAAVVAAIIAAIGAAYLKGKSSERTKQKARNADALEKHYDDISKAADARSNVTADSMRDKDPYQRD